MRLLANSVTVHLSEVRGPMSRDNFHVVLDVDRVDHLIQIRHHNPEKASAIIEELEDLGYGEWHAIGPEDKEFFATEKLTKLILPALKALPDGWQDL